MQYGLTSDLVNPMLWPWEADMGKVLGDPNSNHCLGQCSNLSVYPNHLEGLVLASSYPIQASDSVGQGWGLRI